ncbi:YeeE/YedE family protein [Xenorhabdus sp. PR6a]|uniref:YeeE/YedE family protein n=1 Tax=Xenorhabdus sp. PR6a TaxID=3025877 RepID=UPI0023584AE3|nr:YeeE/YedE family protein [Xenorhabdus sp. PR6a]MDC9580623.1 YeeE/YedE family protein [Xenorhabdus sp. PR6a]
MVMIFSLLSGVIFGLGLIISGMANPAKVLGFLDLAHPWDPSLAFVMMGAILVGLVGFMLAKRRQYALCGTPMILPDQRQIDWRLMGGAALFGLGWGIAGICPGPGLVLLGAGHTKGSAFIVAMIIGMVLVDRKK